MRDRKAIGLLVAALLMSMVAIAQEVVLTPDAPTRYIVKKGDTLWDISTVFLVEPWRWPEIWEANPQVANPHLIYPGDELALFYRDGRPVIQLRREAEVTPEGVTPEGVGPAVIRRQVGPRTVKLSPRAHVLSREDAIPTIPIDAIQQFLARPRVLDPGEFDAAPYIVSVGPEALVGFTGKPVFVRGLREEDGASFGVFRRGQVYRDPQNQSEILGYEAVHVGDVVLEASGDPATLLLSSTNREVLAGDRLLAARDEQVVTNFMPRAPDWEINAQIIAVMDGVTQIGENQIVVLNVGARDGVQQGHVMAVYQLGETVADPIGARPPGEGQWWKDPVDEDQRPQGLQGLPKAMGDTLSAIGTGIGGFVGQFLPSEDDPWRPGRGQRHFVKLPDQRAGAIMVFRPFDRVSYALVMEATRPMHVFDTVTNP